MQDTGDPEAFDAIILDILRLHPAGLSEYDLLQCLRGEPGLCVGLTPGDGIGDLFRRHFLLFHHLYRLRDRLLSERAGDLAIHALNIRLLAFQPVDEGTLAKPDPLRTYYLDLGNLVGTTSEELHGLLKKFWAGFRRQSGRSDALRQLGLPDHADDAAVLRQYRRLAMEHHPDRGGEPSRLKAIHEAMTVLDPRGKRR